MSLLPLPTNLLPYWFFPWNTNTWSGYTPFFSHKELLAVDALRQLYLWREYGFSLLKQGIWPLWNPYSFSGQPLLANFQSGIFYPFSWLFLVFKPIVAWSVYIFMQPPLAGLFMFAFLKNRRLRWQSCLFGALALVSMSYFSTRYFWGVYVHSLLWIPLILLLVDKFKAGRISVLMAIPVLSVFLGLSYLGGYPQHGAFVVILFCLYFLYQVGLKKAWILAVSLILSLGLVAIQIIPTAELYQNSLREGPSTLKTFNNSVLDFKYLITLINPDYFGSAATNNYFGGKDYGGVNNYFGIVPLVFGIYALRLAKKQRYLFFWILVMIGGFIFSYKGWLSYLPSILQIPILSSGGVWNNLFFVQFGGVILATYGFEEFLGGNRNRLRFISITLTLFVGVLIIYNRGNTITVRTTSLIFSYLVVLSLIISRNLRISKYLVLTLLFVSSASYLAKVSPFGELKFFYPKHDLLTYLQDRNDLGREVGFGSARLASNFSTLFRLYSPEGYDSLWPKWYGQLIASTDTGKIPSIVDRADVIISDKDTPYRKKLLDLLGARYFLDKSDDPNGDRGQNLAKFPETRFSLLKQRGILSIYENIRAFPRAFLVKTPIVTQPHEVVDAMFSPEVDLANSVVLEESINQTNLSTGTARIIAYSPNHIDIETKSEANSLLVLTDTYYPGWQARVNGTETKIYKADYAFRAISVPPGQNEVEFTYEPESFTAGSKISLVTIGVLCLIFCLSSRKFIRG